MEQLLKPERFDVDPSCANAEAKWSHWKRTFSNFLAGINNINEVNKLPLLCNYVSESCCSLNSNDVFILETPGQTYLWIGQDSFEEEQEMGRRIVKIASPDRECVEIRESEEPEEFWTPLGGKGDYPKSRDLPSRPISKPRLFRLSDQSGRMKIEEMCNFTQEDLCEDDVMILDTGDLVYIWIGKGANEEEKSGAHKLAEEYMSSEPSDRNTESIVIVTVKQGVEPKAFKSFFQNWNPALWEDLSQLLSAN